MLTALAVSVSAVGCWLCCFVAGAAASKLGVLTSQDATALLRTIFRITLPLTLLLLLYSHSPLLGNGLVEGSSALIEASPSPADAAVEQIADTAGEAVQTASEFVSALQGSTQGSTSGVSQGTAEVVAAAPSASVEAAAGLNWSAKGAPGFLACAVVLIASSATAFGCAWAIFRRRAPVERSMLLASTLGVDLAALGYTAVIALAGADSFALLTNFDVVNGESDSTLLVSLVLVEEKLQLCFVALTVSNK